MAGRGSLPTGTAIRRNAPTIPTTNLPVSGRSTPVPDPPETYDFGPAGMDWWGWAWRTPQACAWDDGSLFAVARRAQLEDDLEAISSGTFDVASLLDMDDEDAMVRKLERVLAKLKALAGGKLGVAREMRELDDRLGLTPRGLAANRWKIVPDDQVTTGTPGPKPPAAKKSTRGRALKAVPAAS